MTTKIVVAYGDGIGPEIMKATLNILEAAKAPITVDTIEIGEAIYLGGCSSGISEDSWDKIKKYKIILKAPITTPLGTGYKSLNVTLRKALGLYANVRPIMSYTPFIKGLHSNIDSVIIRENEEDLYAGIEYRISDSNYVALKIITSQGSESIIRYAFEYARTNNRKKITCSTKNNIMKIVDGHFYNIFKEISTEYPEIETEHMIIDIATARYASKPQMFDVLVTENLYGDIISDVAAEASGSVGLAGSANIGKEYAMFEAIHGSAPDIAGQGKANPSGLLNGAIMMLEHIGYGEHAALIKNALLRTIEDGLHTGDIYNKDVSKKLLSTNEFASAVIHNLGNKPKILKEAIIDKKVKKYDDKMSRDNKDEDARDVVVPNIKTNIDKYRINCQRRRIVGADIFIYDMYDKDVNVVAEKLNQMALLYDLKLKFISCRGLVIWPKSILSSFVPEMLRCRFVFEDVKSTCGKDGLLSAQYRLNKLKNEIMADTLEICSIIMLYEFDGKIGFSMAQNE